MRTQEVESVKTDLDSTTKDIDHDIKAGAVEDVVGDEEDRPESQSSDTGGVTEIEVEVRGDKSQEVANYGAEKSAVKRETSSHPNSSTFRMSIEELRTQPLLKQLRSSEAIAFTIWMSINLLKYNYFFGACRCRQMSVPPGLYISFISRSSLLPLLPLSSLTLMSVSFPLVSAASVDTQLTELGQEDGDYTQLFGIFLFVGTVAVPFMGWVIDRFGFPVSSWCLWGLGLLHTVALAIPNLHVQLATFALFVLFRGWLFAFMLSFNAFTFGYDTFSRVVGVAVLISGGFAALQYPLIDLAVDVLGNDFLPSNLIILGSSAVLVFFPIYLTCHKRPLRKVDSVQG